MAECGGVWGRTSPRVLLCCFNLFIFHFYYFMFLFSMYSLMFNVLCNASNVLYRAPWTVLHAECATQIKPGPLRLPFSPESLTCCFAAFSLLFDLHLCLIFFCLLAPLCVCVCVCHRGKRQVEIRRDPWSNRKVTCHVTVSATKTRKYTLIILNVVIVGVLLCSVTLLSGLIRLNKQIPNHPERCSGYYGLFFYFFYCMLSLCQQVSLWNEAPVPLWWSICSLTFS